MLQLMPNGAPNDLGKRGEITKHSAALDRMTGDDADLRLFKSNDGKRTYLRVWEHPAPAAPSAQTQGAARWYEVIEPPKGDEATTKK